MKVFITSTAVLALLPATLAQTLAPSPTESIGCIPHDDHWHCDGPRTDEASTTLVTISSSITPEAATTTAVEEEEDHDHDHEDEGEEHTDEEHTDKAGTGSLAPSPTESVGCVPHGDHWDCEGPATTAEANATTTTEESAATTTVAAEESDISTPVEVNAAGFTPRAGMLPVLGFAGVAMFAL